MINVREGIFSFNSFSSIFSGQPALYAFQDKDVYEIMKFREQFRSWFVNDSIQEGEFKRGEAPLKKHR